MYLKTQLWIMGIHIYIYSRGMMIGFSSLHLSLCFLSDLLEHYPLVIWGVFACVVVLAVYSGGGVVIIPPEVEVYYRLVSPHYSG